MFTGIIEEVGSVKNINRSSDISRVTIACDKILEDIHTGDSIAVNGICLTVTGYSNDSFSADIMNETIRRTGLGGLGIGTRVNLERALSADGRFGGHIVSGHIDGTGTITSIRNDGSAIWYIISCDKDILAGVVMKGSIAIDGISLTVARVTNADFGVSIIPHTLDNTILASKKVGDSVNLETDIIGKYVLKLVEVAGVQKNGLTLETLLKNGFID